MSWIDDVLPVACLRSRTGNPGSRKVIDPEALSNTVRPSLDEMTQWITDDLEFAAKNAPEVAPDLGRYTRDYARFCLMKHCLNEGEHMEGYYQRAIDMYNELNTGKL